MRIKNVKINGLYNKYNIDLNLHYNDYHNVTILSGLNGSFKTTLLDIIYYHIRHCNQTYIEERCKSVEINLFNEDWKNINHIDSEIVQYILYYFLDIKNETLLLSILNEAFAESHKKFFIKDKHSPYEDCLVYCDDDKRVFELERLSRAESLLTNILVTVAAQNNKEYVLLLDNPDLGLCIEWQEKLIEWIEKLNPNCQIILVTHSPNIIMHGWDSFVINMNSITTKI